MVELKVTFVVAVVEGGDVNVEGSVVAHPGMIVNVVDAYAVVGLYLKHATNQVGGHWVKSSRNMVLSF